MTPDTSIKYIELNVFLRVVMKVASTGGSAKMIIHDGKIKVNGEIETRNRRKLHTGDGVEYEGEKFEVKSDVLR